MIVEAPASLFNKNPERRQTVFYEFAHDGGRRPLTGVIDELAENACRAVVRCGSPNIGSSQLRRARRVDLSFAVHFLFSPWLLVAVAIVAWIEFRPRRSQR